MVATTFNSRMLEENNLKLLQEREPELVDLLSRLEEPPGFNLVPSREGAPTLVHTSSDGRETSLHSRYNPKEEAARLIQDVPTGSSLNILVLGFGLGYHVGHLIGKINKAARVLVIETQPSFLRLALGLPHMREILQFPNLKIVTGPDCSPERLTEKFEEWRDGFTLNGFTPVRFTPITRHFQEEYDAVEGALAEVIRQTQVAHNTRRALSRLLYRNSLQNLENVIRTPGVSSLKGRAKGRAALVVGAGPSLDKNIQLIKGARDRVLVIAVSTAFKPLVEAGINPDFVVAIDPKEISIAAFSNTRIPDSTTLVFDPAIPPKIVQLFPRNRFVADSPLFLWQMISSVLGPKGDLGSSSSVAHTALSLAHHMGCDPIILAGQDLAFSGSRSHCSGSYHLDQHLLHTANNVTGIDLRQKQRAHSEKALRVSRDVFGQTVTTSNALDSFRLPYEQSKENAPRSINATEGGIPLKGFEGATLRETLSTLPPLEAWKCPTESGTSFYIQSLDKLKALLTDQVNRLDTIGDSMQKWLSQTAPKTPADFERRVLSAETVLQKALKDTSSIHLLQEILYGEFLDWNSQNHKIELETDPVRDAEMKFNRDQRLFTKIVEAVRTWDSSLFSSVGKSSR